MKKILLLFITLSLILFSCSENDTTTTDDILPDINTDVLEKDDKSGTDEQNDPPQGEEPSTEPLDETKNEPQIQPEPQETITPQNPDEEQTSSIKVTEIKLSMTDVSVFIGEKQMPIVTMYPQNATDKGEIWVSSDTSVATVDSIGNIRGVSEGKCIVTVTSKNNNAISASVNVTVKAAPECTYIDGILVVNKTYALPSSYAPGWETEASPYVWQMIEAAKKEGLTLWVKSGYRSYYDQQYIYNNYVARDGQAEADTYSARPGHSEHQTGLAFDMNSNDQSFGETAEGKWLAENCYKFGFILRYPKDKEHITGYIYEPWHIRYVGIEKATEIYESGLCLEEFLNITSKYE